MIAIGFIRLRSGGPTDVRCPGEAIAIRVEGLEPGALCELRLARQFRGEPYASTLVVTADAAGVVDTRADPDRPFWSMRRIEPRDSAHPAAGSVQPGRRPQAVVEGTASEITVFDYGLRPTLRLNANPASEPGFECSVVRGEAVVARRGLGVAAPEGQPLAGGLVGRLYLPAVEGPRPAVVTLGGSNGGIEDAAEYAAALAHHGFVALALAYFGAPPLPRELARIPVEYVERALRVLQAHPAVLADRIGVVGRSRGGELALLAGSLFPEVATVVAHAGSTYRWVGEGGLPAWEHRGVELPHLVPSSELDVEWRADGRMVVAASPAFQATLDHASEGELAGARIAVDRPVLLLCGDDDAVWPAAWFAQDALRRDGPVESRTFPGAGHRATLVPGDPTTDTMFRHRTGIWLKHGGTAEGDAAAQRTGWDLTLGFLRRQLGLDESDGLL